MEGRMGVRPEPRPGSWVKCPRESCVINRWTYPYASYQIEGPKVAWTHNNCLCNQLIALQYRHQVATPVVEWLDEAALSRIFDRLRADNPVSLVPWKRHKVVNGYSGPWRAKYFEAQQEYHRTGLLPWHASVRMFPKDDLEMGTPEKAPRAIQYRHPVFALEQGRFTKPIEAWFYKLHDEFDTIIVAKSDPFTIAAQLQKKASCFANPVFLMLDASKFDSCVDKLWLKFILSCYLKLFPKRFHRAIIRLWSQTWVNRGSTRKGLRYKTDGTRMSGDMDTSLGNSLIMWLMLKFYLEKSEVRGSIMVNGDDSLIVVESSSLERLRQPDNFVVFFDFGFRMKFEVAYCIEQAEFCQSRWIETDYGPTMARKPFRIMGRTAWTTQRYGKPRILAFINTLGQCERAASFGVPIASVMATKMIERAATTRMVPMKPWLAEYYQMLRRWWRVGPPVISVETRQSFATAWDITIEEQIDIERSIVVTPLRGPTLEHEQEFESLIN